MPEFVTIYADAAMCSENKVGGWACWIKHGNDQKVIVQSAPFKTPISNPTIAALYAISNAIVHAIEKVDLKPGTVLVVNSDSSDAIDILNHIGEPLRNQEQRSVRARINMLRPRGVQIHFKKVRANNVKEHKRTYVNDVVDSAANSAKVRALDALKAPK